MTSYFLQVNLYLSLFYTIYVFFLHRETFFRWNRAYLLVSVVMSLLVPLLPIPTSVHQSELVSNLSNLGEPAMYLFALEASTTSAEDTPDTFKWFWIFYGLGVGVLGLKFLYDLWRIFKLIMHYGIQRKDEFYWVQMKDQSQVFSFFSILFWGAKIDLESEEQNQILQHELVHIRQWHSLDIVCLELLKIVFWFNPVCYFLKKSIRQIHEYLADAAVLRQDPDKKTYATLLVQHSLWTENLTLGNMFFNQSLLKSRINMLYQIPSKTSARLKFVLTLPVLVACVLVASCAKRQLEEMSPSPNPKAQYEIPEGYKLLFSKNVSAKTLPKYKYIFSKGTHYSIGVVSAGANRLNVDDIRIKVYQMKDENEIDALVADNLNEKKQVQNSLEYTPDKTSMIVVEVAENNSSEDFTLNISFKRDEPVSPNRFANIKDNFPKEKAAQIINISSQKSAKIQIEPSKLYYLIAYEPSGKDVARFYVKFPDLTKKYASENQDFSVLGLFMDQLTACEVFVEAEDQNKIYEIMVFVEDVK